jgi:hypothetical protein
MTRKDSQVLIFNKERILIALTTSTRSAALLTGVNEKRTGPGHYYYRINHQPLIGDDSLAIMTLTEYDCLDK